MACHVDLKIPYGFHSVMFFLTTRVPTTSKKKFALIHENKAVLGQKIQDGHQKKIVFFSIVTKLYIFLNIAKNKNTPAYKNTIES
jgi:hypothetical protein